jgi:hypothetical protein
MIFNCGKMNAKKSLTHLTGLICLLMLMSGCTQKKGNYTRGVGIDPGSQAEDFSPTLVTDDENYRNLAKLRPAYNSSSYDYNSYEIGRRMVA